MVDSHAECFDVAIVGGGPAGLNAALVLGRARRRVALCDAGDPRNAAATEMHGFVSRDGYSPRRLESIARDELRRYPSVQIFDESVEDVARDAGFTATLASGRTVRAKRLLLATGMRDDLPPILGIDERWGHSVFVCPHCDGWEFQDRRIGVYGAPADSVGLAQELRRWSSDLTVFGVDPSALDGERAAWLAATGLPCVAAAPAALEGEAGTLSAVVLPDGSRRPVDVLFLCVALLQRSPLPERLGCAIDPSGAVHIDAEHRTNVPGVYACGDMVTNVHQVIVAASSGVQAAIALSDSLLDDEIAQTVAAG